MSKAVWNNTTNPGTPAAGKLNVWSNTATKRLNFTDDAGVTGAVGKDLPFKDFVQDYGGNGDGTTDNRAALVAAFADLSAGGMLFVPKAAVSYQISNGAALVLPANNFAFVGAERGACKFEGMVGWTTGDMFQLQSGGDQVRIANLWFSMKSSTERTTGATININGCHDVILENLTIYFPYIGIQISGGGTKTYAHNIDIKVPTKLTSAANSCGILLDNGTTGDTYLGPHINIESASGANKAQDGIRIAGTGYVQLTEIAATAFDIGCHMIPTAGKTILNVFASKCLWDTNASVGLKINASTATSVIRQVRFTDSWAAGCTAGPGIQTTGTGAGVLDDFAWVGGRVLSNSTHGILHGFGTNVNILGNTIAGNSTAGSGSNDGINIAANLGGFIIANNRICGVNTFASNQRWAINIAAGAPATSFAIVGNDLTGNVTGGLNDASVVGASLAQQKSISGNLGLPVGVTSINRQAIAIATTYVGGLLLPSNSLRVGSHFRITLNFTNPATAATVTALVKYGPNASTADTTIHTAGAFTGTAAADVARIILDVHVDTLNAATGTVTVHQLMVRNLDAGVTGFHNVAGRILTSTQTATLNTTTNQNALGVALTGAVAATTILTSGTIEVIA